MANGMTNKATRVRKTVLRPPDRPPTPGHAPGIATDTLIFVSGQVARDSDGNTVGVNDCRSQAEQVFVNIELILRSAGASLKDIVKTTVYLVDPADLTAYADVREKYLGPNQASTLVYVSGLIDSEWLIEVDAIAVRDSTDRS
jgi:2-iminobutanoate/2-iminopropanoate deaminase